MWWQKKTQNTHQCKILKLNCRGGGGFVSRVLHITLCVRQTLRYPKLPALINSCRRAVTQHRAREPRAFLGEAIYLHDGKYCSAPLNWFYTYEDGVTNLILSTSSGQNLSSLGWTLCSLASLDQQHTLRVRYRGDIFIWLDCKWNQILSIFPCHSPLLLDLFCENSCPLNKKELMWLFLSFQK